MYMSICCYLRVLPVLHRPEVVDIGVKPFLSIMHGHGDLCKHLGIDSSTDLDDLMIGTRIYS